MVKKTVSKVELHSESDSCNADSESVGTDEETCNSEDHSLSFFEYLPAELLQKIFSYFSQYQLCKDIAPVCRRWRDFAYDPIHWQKLILDLKQTVEPDILRKLFDRTCLLKHLVLSANRGIQFSIDDLSIFDSGMPCLRELHLTFFELLDVDYLTYVLQKAPGLEHLNIEGCTKVNNSCIEEICRLVKLKALNISHCRRITDAGLIQLAKEIKCLKLLNIDGITHISERSIECLVEMHFQHLRHLYLDGEGMSDLRCLSRCSDLQTLSISYTTNLDDSFLAGIIKFSNLEVLRLRKGDTFTSSALKTFFEKTTMKKLTSLDLSECVLLDDFVLAAICSRYGRFLNKLVLSWCWEVTDVGLEAIVNNCRGLCHLDLIGLHRITGRCFQKIPDLMPCLTFIDLTKCNEDSATVSVRDPLQDTISIECLVEMHFQHLRHLYLDGEGMSDLRCLSRCSDLQTLSISYTTNLDDSFLAGIIKFSNLEVLRLRKGDTFTSSALKTFFEKTTMKKLTSLDLSECVLLDDFVLAAICSRYGRFLNKLVLSWCWEVTDVGLEAIVNNCRGLCHLDLIGLHRITGRCFQKIPDLMPCLTFIDLTKCNEIDDSVLSEVVCRKTDITARDYYGEPYQNAADG